MKGVGSTMRQILRGGLRLRGGASLDSVALVTLEEEEEERIVDDCDFELDFDFDFAWKSGDREEGDTEDVGVNASAGFVMVIVVLTLRHNRRLVALRDKIFICADFLDTEI